MKLVEVEAVEDRSRAEGGHVVILLRGVGQAGNPVRLSLRLLEAEGAEGKAAERGLSDLEPVQVGVSDDGLALTLGPEVTENPAFVPGVAVEITMSHPRLRGEFLWPAVTPVVRPKRRNIMVRRPGVNATARGPAAAAPAAPARAGSSRAAGLDQAIGTMAGGPGDDVATADPAVPSPEVIGPQSETALPERAEAQRSATAQAQVPDAAGEVPPARKVPPAVAPVNEPVTEPAGEPMAPAVAQREPSFAPVPAPALAPAPAAIAQPSTSPPSLEPQPFSPTSPTKLDDSAPAGPDTPPRAAHSAANSPGARRMSAGAAAALAIVLMIAGQAVMLRVLDLSVAPRAAREQVAAPSAVAPPSPPPASAPVAAPVQETPAVAADAPPPVRSLHDVIAVGPRSPRGVGRSDVSPANALQFAHVFLNGSDVQRDAEEAQYWLKHYLATAAGSDNFRIALTQLGSAYAQPVRGARDLDSARIVWELAGALGDPVAMCFVGALYEHGLGVPASSKTAGVWYQRAGAAGRTCATQATVAGEPAR